MSLTKLKDKISNSGKNSDKYKIIFQFDFLNFITFGQWEPDQLILRFKRGNIQKTELTPNWLTTAKTKYGTMGKVLWQKPTSVDFILGLYPNSKLSCGYDEKMITISIENISPSNKSTKLAEYTFNLAEFVGKTKESQLLEIDCPTVSWKIALARLGITMKTSLIKKSKSSNDLQEDYLIEKGHGYENNKENEDPVKPSKYFSSNELDINKILHVHDEPSSSSRNNSMTDRNGRQLHYFKTASILMEKKSFKQVKALYIRRSKTTDIDHCNGIRNYATKAYNDAYLTCINVDKIKINPDFTPKYRDAPLSISENHISMQVSKIFRGYFDHAYHSLCIDSLPVGRFITASFSSQYSKIHKDSYNQIVAKNRWKECSMRQSTLSHPHEFDVLGFTIAMDDQDQSAASSFGSSSQIYSNGTDGQQGDDEGEPWWPSVKNSSKLNQSAVDEDPRYFVCDSSNLPMTPDLEIQRQSVSASSINQQQQKEENEISPLSNEVVSVTEEIATDQACNIISSNAKEKHELIALEKSKASDELKMEISTLGEVISGLKYALGDKDSHIR
ncbi:EH domain-binding protein 1 [Trichoplax sp. H2]|nr:EH domain-binding protein 1 [Trichoplax sp. H2]|eukprot:RDD37454.1 EH domain-binding protein 1 [Trichoplax sp. H2]